MAVNPMELMKLGERLRIFREQHPKVEKFIRDNFAGGLEEGSVMEIKVTKPDGKAAVCNFRVSPEDLETIRIIHSIRNN